jgi:transposase
LIDYIEKQSHFFRGGRLNNEILQSFIQQVFAVNCLQNSVYNLLKSQGLSWTTSFSKHPKQSEEAQEDFKKTSNRNDQADPQTYYTR